MTDPAKRNHRVSDATAAIIAMCLAMTCFIVSDVFSKLASGNIPISQLLTMRGFYAAVVFALPVVAAGSWRLLPSAFSRLWVARIVGEIGASLAFLAALMHLPIASVTTIMQTSPLATTAAAAIFLSERVSVGQWAATIGGFLGVLLIVQPGSDAFSWWSLIALVSVGFVIVRDLMTRRMDAAIPAALINVTTSAAVAIAGYILNRIGSSWVATDMTTEAQLFCSGAAIGIAYHFLIVAIRKAPLATVAPFRYIIVPLSILAGWLFWRDIPNPLALAGIVVIAASGLYTFLAHRT